MKLGFGFYLCQRIRIQNGQINETSGLILVHVRNHQNPAVGELYDVLVVETREVRFCVKHDNFKICDQH